MPRWGTLSVGTVIGSSAKISGLTWTNEALGSLPRGIRVISLSISKPSVDVRIHPAAVVVASLPPSPSRAGQDGGVRISARADYAVRSMLEIAAARIQPREIGVDRRVPADSGQVPEQILAELRRAGLVTSRRGAVGGYALARPAAEISVADVIRGGGGPLAWVRDSRPGSIEYEGNAESLAEVWVAVRSALRSYWTLCPSPICCPGIYPQP